MVPSWVGMGMHSSAITGNSQVFQSDQTGFHRRNNSDKIEKFLKSGFKIKGNIFSGKNTIGKELPKGGS